jgi:hypothetical protein
MGRLERLASEPAVRAYRYTKTGQEHHFLFATAERAWTFGAWTSDAQVLYWSVNREPEQRVLILCHGTYAEVAGVRVLASDVRVGYAEVVGSPTKTELFSSDPGRVQLQGSLERMETESTVPADPKRIGA